MYIPAAFREDRVDVIHDLMRQHSFATLISYGAEGLVATHLPLLLDANRRPRGTIVGHMARANPQWRGIRDGQESLAMSKLTPHLTDLV